jgi:hypothetical protein
MPNSTVKSTLAMSLLLATACSFSSDRGAEGGQADSPSAVSAADSAAAGSTPFGQATGGAPAESAAPEQAGMTTTDGAVRMALVGDRVVVGLSDSIVGQIRGKLDTSAAPDTGRGVASSLGNIIKGAVKSAVGGALGTKVEYPLSEIEELSYDGTRLHLVVRGKGEQLDNTNVNNRPLLESFRPEDARRFVEAVRAAKGAQGGGGGAR